MKWLTQDLDSLLSPRAVPRNPLADALAGREQCYDAPALHSAIMAFVRGREFKFFRIGITDDPWRRRIEHDLPEEWKHWRVESGQLANALEARFIGAGMAGGTGGSSKGTYLYVFKLSLRDQLLRALGLN